MPKVIPGYKDDAKRKIIQAAIEVIAERGFAQTTIDEIAKRLGVSKGAVYWYFPNKDALLKEAFSYIHDDYKRIAYDKYYNHSIEELLHVIYNRFSSGDTNTRNIFFEMVAMSQRNITERNMVSSFLLDLVKTITGIIEGEQRDKKIPRDIEPEIFAMIFVCQFVGIHMLSTLWIPQDKIDKMWGGFVSHMLFQKNPGPERS